MLNKSEFELSFIIIVPSKSYLIKHTENKVYDRYVLLHKDGTNTYTSGLIKDYRFFILTQQVLLFCLI